MERTIKFKAKRVNDGMWVEGYYYKECDNTYIIEDRQNESMLNRNEVVLVDPSTVCQFTGLKDMDGNEIWEGDYLNNGIFVYEVVWTENAAFALRMEDSIVKIGKRFIGFVSPSDLGDKLGGQRWRIVGNRFDGKK